MVKWDSNLRVPAIIEADAKHCDIYIPDLEITIHGRDYISAVANAVTKCTAIYYYFVEHNLPFNLTKKYADVEMMALERGNGCFATYMQLCE